MDEPPDIIGVVAVSGLLFLILGGGSILHQVINPFFDCPYQDLDWSEVNDGKLDCVDSSDEKYISILPLLVFICLFFFFHMKIQDRDSSITGAPRYPLPGPFKGMGEPLFLLRLAKYAFFTILAPYGLTFIFWMCIGFVFWPVSARGDILLIYPYELLVSDLGIFILAVIASISLLDFMHRRKEINEENKKENAKKEADKLARKKRMEKERKDAHRAKKEFMAIGLTSDLSSVEESDISFNQFINLKSWLKKHSQNDYLDEVFIRLHGEIELPIYGLLTVDQLKDLLRENGLQVTGKKIDLIQRLEKQHNEAELTDFKDVSLSYIRDELQRLRKALDDLTGKLRNRRHHLSDLEDKIIEIQETQKKDISAVKATSNFINVDLTTVLQKHVNTATEFTDKEVFEESTAAKKKAELKLVKSAVEEIADCSKIAKEAMQKIEDASKNIDAAAIKKCDLPVPESFNGFSDYSKALADAKPIISKAAAEIQSYAETSRDAVNAAKKAEKRATNALKKAEKAKNNIRNAQKSDDIKRKKAADAAQKKADEAKKIEQEENYFRHRFGYKKSSLAKWKDIQKQEKPKRQRELSGLLKGEFATHLLVAYLSGQIDKRTLLHLKKMKSLPRQWDNHRLIPVVLLYEHNRAVRLSGCDPIPMPDNLSNEITDRQKTQLYNSQNQSTMDIRSQIKSPSQRTWDDGSDYNPSSPPDKEDWVKDLENCYKEEKWIVNEEQMKVMIPDLDELHEPWERIQIHFEVLVEMEESHSEITEYIGKLDQIHEFKVIHDLARSKNIGVEERKLLSRFVTSEIPIETIYRYVVDLELTKDENLNALSRILNGEDEEAVLFEFGLWQD